MMENRRRSSELYRSQQSLCIRINYVKMKIKFHCKMKIQCNGQALTSEVASGPQPDLYIFNQDVILGQHQLDHNVYVLSLYIITPKGTKYIAAVANIPVSGFSQSSNSDDNQQIIKLSKCLDSEATMSIVLKMSKSQIFSNQESTAFNRNSYGSFFPKKQQRISLNESDQKYKTKPPCSSRNYKSRQKVGHQSQIIQAQRLKSQSFHKRDSLEMSIQNRKPMNSRVKQRGTSKLSNRSQQQNLKTSPVEIETDLMKNAYEESYQKLQHKLKIQPNTTRVYSSRIKTEVNQNETKLKKLNQIMQKEQSLMRLSENQRTISKLQRRNSDLSHLVKTLTDKLTKASSIQQDNERVINKFEIEIQEMSNELTELKSKSGRASREFKIKEQNLFASIRNKQKEIERLNLLLQNQESSRTLSLRENQAIQQHLAQKNNQISDFQHDIQRLKLQETITQQQSTKLQNQNYRYEQKLQQLTNKIAEYESTKIKAEQAHNTLQKRLSSLSLTMLNNQKKKQQLELELSDAVKFKDKYNQSLVEIRKLETSLRSMQKNYENGMLLATNNLNNMQNKLQKDSEVSYRKISELESQNMKYVLQIKELENTINFNLKGQVENLKRKHDKLSQQNQELKRIQRNLSKEARTSQSKIQILTGQLQSYKNQYHSLQTQMKIEMERQNSQSRHLKQQHEREVMKNIQQRERQSKAISENNLLSSKIKIIEQSQQRQTKALTQKLELINNNNSRLEQQRRRLQTTVKQLKEKEREYVTKVNYLSSSQGEYTGIIKKYEQQLSKAKKQIQEIDRISKQQQFQTKNLQKQLKEVEEKNEQLTGKFSELKQLHSRQTQKISKLQLQKQSDDQKTQHLTSKLETQLTEKQKQLATLTQKYDQSSKDLAHLKENLLRKEMLLQSNSTDQNRFQQYLLDILTREHANIQSDPNLKPKQSTTGMETSRGLRNSQKQEEPLQNQIINMMNTYTKLSRSLLNSWSGVYKKLENKYDKMQEQLERERQQSKQQIEQTQQKLITIESQLEKIKNSFKHEEKSLLNKLDVLTKENSQYREELEMITIKEQELQFTFNGQIIQNQNEKESYQGQLNEKTQIIKGLQEKLSQNYQNLNTQQSAYLKLQQEIELYQDKIQQQEQTISQYSTKLKTTTNELQICNKLAGEAKNKNKQLLSRISQLEMLYSNEQQKNSYNHDAMAQQQRKLEETKSMINQLIKQKQAIIKQEIINSQTILELETLKEQLNQKVSILQNENCHQKDQLNSQKSDIKKLAMTNKQMQIDIGLNEDKIAKLNTKLKEKDKKIAECQSNYRNLQFQSQTHLQKLQRENRRAQEQLSLKCDMMRVQLETKNSQYEQLQQQSVPKLNEQIKYTSFSLQNAHREIQQLKHQLSIKQQEVCAQKQSCMELMRNKEQIYENLQVLMQECREKDEKIYHIEGQLGEVQNRFKETVLKYQKEIKTIKNNYEEKQEILCEDYEAKIQLCQKQNAYIQDKLKTAEQDLIKLNDKNSSQQNQSVSALKILKQKIIKVEEEKKATIAKLKLELQQFSNECSVKEEEIKKKNNEIVVLKHQLANQKSNSNKLAQHIKQNEAVKGKLQDKLSLSAEEYKKKQLFIQSIEQKLKTYQWTLQREIKKSIQVIKKSTIEVVGTNESPQRQKVLQNFRDIETQLLKNVYDKILA